MQLARVLEAIAAKPARSVVGLISGTSADSIYAALVRITGQGPEARVEVQATHAHPYPPGLQERLHALTESGSVRDVCELNVTVGELFAAAAPAVSRGGVVGLIGSRSPTRYHISP